MSLALPVMIRRVHGHSMMPVLPPGTLVFAWRWYVRIRIDSVVILTLHNREVIKRVHRVEREGLFLLGDHPDASTDSRSYGLVPLDAVNGFVFWPRTRKAHV